MDTKARFRGCLLGLAAGDAVGTTVEFAARGSFAPVADMVGGGPFHLKPGQWTDDTSMALCLATSLVDRKGHDARDQMQRYVRWRREGYLSATGECFDIGTTVSRALSRFTSTGDPVAGSADPQSAGNGSIMRLAPVPLWYFPDRDETIRYAADSSRTTHGAEEAVDACRLMAAMLHRALSGADKAEVVAAGVDLALAPGLRPIALGGYRHKSVSDVRGDGYVVRSLEAALWCFWHTDSFRDAILASVNLGEDADTTAAVCGQIAGAHYGVDGIPVTWRERTWMARDIVALADALHDRPRD